MSGAVPSARVSGSKAGKILSSVLRELVYEEVR